MIDLFAVVLLCTGASALLHAAAARRRRRCHLCVVVAGRPICGSPCEQLRALSKETT